MNDAAHELTVETPAATFAGTLWLAPGGGRATVLMHPGSGPSDRDNDVYFPPIREHLLGAGYAVCSFDKRGVGGSTGRWQDAGVVDQADDAIAQLGALLEAASRERRAAFVVSSSGPGVSPAEQERYSTGARLDASGAAEEEIADPVRTFDAVIALLRSGVATPRGASGCLGSAAGTGSRSSSRTGDVASDPARLPGRRPPAAGPGSRRTSSRTRCASSSRSSTVRRRCVRSGDTCGACLPHTWLYRTAWVCVTRATSRPSSS